MSNQPIFPSPCYLPACTWVEKMKGNSFLVTPGGERVIKSDKCGAEQLCNEVAVTFCRDGCCGEAATLFQAACMSKGQIQGLLFGVNF